YQSHHCSDGRFKLQGDNSRWSRVRAGELYCRPVFSIPSRRFPTPSSGPGRAPGRKVLVTPWKLRNRFPSKASRTGVRALTVGTQLLELTLGEYRPALETHPNE